MKHLCLAFAFPLILSSNLFAHNPLKWQDSPPVIIRYFNGAYAIDINTIILTGGNETNDAIRTIIRSTDGGETWDLTLDMVDSSWLKSVYFINDSMGFAVGNNGSILKTSNAGQSWNPQATPANTSERNFNCIFFINSQI